MEWRYSRPALTDLVSDAVATAARRGRNSGLGRGACRISRARRFCQGLASAPPGRSLEALPRSEQVSEMFPSSGLTGRSSSCQTASRRGRRPGMEVEDAHEQPAARGKRKGIARPSRGRHAPSRAHRDETRGCLVPENPVAHRRRAARRPSPALATRAGAVRACLAVSMAHRDQPPGGLPSEGAARPRLANGVAPPPRSPGARARHRSSGPAQVGAAVRADAAGQVRSAVLRQGRSHGRALPQGGAMRTTAASFGHLSALVPGGQSRAPSREPGSPVGCCGDDRHRSPFRRVVRSRRALSGITAWALAT